MECAVCAVLVLAVLSQCVIYCSVAQYPKRVAMDQDRSCHYLAHNLELVCQCRVGEDKSYLNLRLRKFIVKSGKQVSVVVVMMVV